jgi:signal transduction histidine kinase
MKRAIKAFCLSLGALILFSLSVQAMATDKVVEARKPGQGAVSLTEYFAILEDPEQTLTLADVRKPDVADRFVTGHPPVEALNYRLSQSAYWLRLTVRNASAQPVRQMLEIAYPLLSHIEWYQMAADGSYQSVATGAAMPFSTRPYPNRFFVFPLVLPAQSEQVVYLRIQSTIITQIPARLWEPGDFDAWELHDYAIQAWFFGMLTALILFNFLIFVALRDVTYLLYVFFAISMALTISAGNGWGKEFLWPDTTWWSDIAVSVLGAFTQAALLAFMRRLLGTRELAPRLDRVIRVLIGIHLLFSVGFAVSILTFTRPGAVRDGATLILILSVGIYCALVKKQRLAAFFVLASSMWVFGVVVVALRGYGLLPSNAFTMNGWQIGSVSEMLLLAFALAYRFNLIRRKADEDVRLVNASLAERLREREAELNRSHERLREIEQRQTLSQERQRLMQDMHDGLGSSLASALRVVERGQLNEAEVALVLKGCIDDLKLAIDSMEPVEADLLLLLATLRFRLGPRLEASGIALRWDVQDLPALEWLDPKNALHILRILQEAFTNIIKHTNATEIRVATRALGDQVEVTVVDNGPGFDVEAAFKNGGKGLSNQRRRAQAIGAELTWRSSDAGTCLTLRLPIARPAGVIHGK